MPGAFVARAFVMPPYYYSSPVVTVGSPMLYLVDTDACCGMYAGACVII